MKNITEHITEKARLFLRNDIRAFIKDVYDNYHFCNIIEVQNEWIIIEHFKGTRKGERIRIFTIDIKLLEEYREVGE